MPDTRTARLQEIASHLERTGFYTSATSVMMTALQRDALALALRRRPPFPTNGEHPMSEEIGTTVEFGGKINRSAIEAIEECLYEQGDSIEDAAREKRHCRTSGCTNYGGGGELVDVLHEHKIAYRLSSDAKYEYDGECSMYDPETGEVSSVPSDQNGTPYIRITELRERRKSGKTLDDVIAELERFTKPLPPVEIVEDEAVEGGAEESADA